MELKSAEVVEKLMEVFKDEGLMTSPTAGHTNVKKGKLGRKIESFTFGISRLCDGVVDVYHKGFIVLKWKTGTYPKDQSFQSMDEVIEWAKNNEWAN